MNLNGFIWATTTIMMVIIKANKIQKLRNEKDNILNDMSKPEFRIITGITHILTQKITVTFSDFC